MLQGTTELYNIGGSNIVSPLLRVNIMQNTFVSGGNYVKDGYIGGIPFFDGVPLIVVSDAIYYNNRFIFTGNESTSNAAIKSLPYTLGTNSVSLSLGTTFTNAKFNVTGNTLSLFYNLSNKDIYRISTNNGVSWSGTTLIISGSTYETVFDIAPINDIEVYVAAVGSTFITSGSERYYTISYRNISTGVSRVIINRDFTCTVGVTAINHTINAERIESTDRLVFIDRTNSNYKVKFALSDTVQSFLERDLVSLVELGQLTLSNYTKGVSYSYTSFDMTLPNIFTNGGVTVQKNYQLPNTIVKFYNDDPYYPRYKFVTYTGITFTGITLRSEKNLVLCAGSTNQVGATSFDYLVYGGATISFITTRNQSVDISDRILTYSNINNERVNLTLGNYA